MDYLNAFWVGGVICALVQILLDKTKLLPGRVMVLLVCSGVVLSAAGIYQPLTEYAGAGASVPLLGFGNILWTGMKKPLIRTGSSGFLPAVLLHVRQAYPPLLFFPTWPVLFSGPK